jgi:hypothetical protein
VAVSAAGDVNGDDLDDILIGASRYDGANDQDSEGAAFVVFGDTEPANVDLPDLVAGTDARGFLIQGDEEAGHVNVGDAVSGVGDLNDDGLADLLIGAYSFDQDEKIQSGAAYVVFGKETTTPIDLGDLDDGGFALLGGEAGDEAGFAVAGLGDLNGDGINELLIGAPGADKGDPGNSGLAYVVFGKGTTESVDLGNLGTGGFIISGEVSGDRLGEDVSNAGDVNGDGKDDLLLIAPEADPEGASSGSGYIVYGKETTTTVDLRSMGDRGIEVAGDTGGNRPSRRVTRGSGLGDVNGDGLSDVALAEPSGFILFDDTVGGGVYILLGSRTDTVTLESNFTSGAPGSTFVLTTSRILFDATMTIDIREPGSDTFRTLTRTSVTAGKQIVFGVDVPEDAPTGMYTIRVTVESSKVSTATTLVAEQTLDIQAEADIHTDQPPADAPILDVTQGTISVYLPLVQR